MTILTILKSIVSNLMLFLDVFLRYKQIHVAEDEAAAADTVQTTLDDVTSANSVADLIDNLNDLKTHTK